MSDAVEGQIERFAPGFRDLVLARAMRGPAEMEAENPNYIGGDINGGTGRPAPGFGPPGAAHLALYDSQPPDLPVLLIDAPRGGGVHGMCGYHAARSALWGGGSGGG